MFHFVLSLAAVIVKADDTESGLADAFLGLGVPRIPTIAEVAEMKALIVEWLEENPNERYAHILRWSFHDAGTWDVREQNGGAHGCAAVVNSIQFNAPQNEGFENEPVKTLLEVYYENEINLVVTRADFFHYAATIAVLEGSKAAGEALEVPFRWGRSECRDQGEAFNAEIGYSARLPPPTLFWDGILDNMGTKMGLSVVEIVALMGGHTFGEMGNHGSAYNLKLLKGTWTQNGNIFNNEYYVYLNQRNWNPREPKGDRGVFRVQWGGFFDEKFKAVFAEDCNGVCNFITMLRTDMELAYQTKDEKCTVGPEWEWNSIHQFPRQCPDNIGPEQFVEMFAKDNTAFLNAFKKAWQKLQEFTTDKLFFARDPMSLNVASTVNNNANRYGSNYATYPGNNNNNDYANRYPGSYNANNYNGKNNYNDYANRYPKANNYNNNDYANRYSSYGNYLNAFNPYSSG